MSRLSDLLRAASHLDPQLAKDLEEEIQPLQKRLRFGLNFERHAPEAVELAGHKIRRGSKVRVLPPRGDTSRGDRRLWRVESLDADEAVIATDNGVVANIVDPHGHWLPDAISKLHGMARYAEGYGDKFRRLESISRVDGELRVLDFTSSEVRAHVLEETDADFAYRHWSVSYAVTTSSPISAQGSGPA